jgi:tetratricopeptide (TPR) repeat protein
MLRNVVAAAALAQTLAWTPAAPSARRTPLHAAEETDALAQIQSLEELEADYWSSLDDVERQIQGASRSGAAFLRQGDLEGALEQFDRAQQLSKNSRYEWHRGICLYYLDRFDDARVDFVENAQRYEERFFEPASEERLFAQACALRGVKGADFAAASELRETRPVLRACAALFGGDANAAKTLRELCDRTDSVDALRRRLLGHFYAGLYHDALHDSERAKAHLALAVVDDDQDFTARLPRLHAFVRGWSLDDVPQDALRKAAAFDLGSQGMEDILDDPDTMREGIDAMTVAMLKEALKARGLKRTGLKADLKKRLLEDLGLN